jgi:hypothetical protein
MMTAFWDTRIAQYSLFEVHRRFRGTYCFHYQSVPIALMKEVVCTSETSVYTETTRRCIPKGCHLHTCHRENLKSHKVTQVTKMVAEISGDVRRLDVLRIAHRGTISLKLWNSHAFISFLFYTRFIKRRERVVNTPALYSAGSWFTSQHGDRLPWLRFFVVFLSPSGG